MKRVYDNCCGIDVHKKLIVACFKQGSEQEVREFGATTRELLELVRYRKSLVGERTRELNRLQKMLEGANIKLSGTVSNINGKSARAILEHVLTGESFDDAKYDEMYENNVISHRLKASKEEIIDDLNGVMSALQRRMMKELLIHLDE